MSYTKQSINDLFTDILKQIDISDEMFTKARNEYDAISKWIDKHSEGYQVSIYPQGSFALGTVIRPISNKDDYDVDLVCELAEQYNLTSEQLKKEVVKPWLETYRRVDHIEEKRRCWHVEYSDVPNFHMDVIPCQHAAANTDDLPDKAIKITEHNEEKNTYRYIPSNPKGYIDWFFSRCQVRLDAIFESYSQQNIIKEQADIEKIKRNKVKTPLQKAIQILKRHRDIMFEKNPDDKPISIIITTLAAQLYNNEDNIVDALNSFLDGAEAYINDNKRNNRYYIENPSLNTENFADKWNKHPERAQNFFEWIHKTQEDFDIKTLQNFDRVQMGKHINDTFGQNTGRAVYKQRAENEVKAVSDQNLRVNPANGNISKAGSVAIPLSHHYEE